MKKKKKYTCPKGKHIYEGATNVTNQTYLYNLGQLRSDVYRALDEYSSNGIEHERCDGGTADTDKRFTAALNRAIRRLYLSSARTLYGARVVFYPGKVLFSRDGFLVGSGESEELSLPDGAYAVSFDCTGKGSLIAETAAGEKTVFSLSSDFGCYESARFFLPDGCAKITFSAAGSLLIRSLRVYSNAFLPEKSDENTAFLPDGRKLYCSFPPLCAELCSVTKERSGEKIPCERFSFENGVLSCDERLAGEYTVYYYAYPEPIAENAPCETPVPLPPAASDALIYLVAAELCDREDGELYTRLLYKYRELLTNTYPSENIKRKNRYYAGRSFGLGKTRLFRG